MLGGQLSRAKAHNGAFLHRIVAVAVKETRLRDSSRTLLPTKERLADFVLTLKCEENVVNRDRLTIRAGLP